MTEDERTALVEELAERRYNRDPCHQEEWGQDGYRKEAIEWRDVDDETRQSFLAESAEDVEWLLAAHDLDAVLGENCATLTYQPGEFTDTPDGATGPWMEPYYMAEVSVGERYGEGYGESHMEAIRNAVAQAKDAHNAN